jgi:LysM repeat protein
MNKPFIFSLLAISQLVYSSDYQIYKVKKGDTLSGLLQSRTTGNLYNKNGHVNSSLKINRLNMEKAKRLEIGSYVILPGTDKDKSQFSSSLASSAASSSAENSSEIKTGLLNNKTSDTGDFELSARFFARTLQLDDGSNVDINENYEAKIKYIPKNNGNPTISLAVSNSNGIVFEDDKDKLVEFKPNFELESSYTISKNKIVNVGLLASASEESSIANNQKIRRDQNIWLGSLLNRVFTFRTFDLDLIGSFKYNIIQNQIDNDDELSLIKANIEARINLTNDLFLSTFIAIEEIDRTSQAAGLTFTYKL